MFMRVARRRLAVSSTRGMLLGLLVPSRLDRHVARKRRQPTTNLGRAKSQDTGRKPQISHSWCSSVPLTNVLLRSYSTVQILQILGKVINFVADNASNQ